MFPDLNLALGLVVLLQFRENDEKLPEHDTVCAAVIVAAVEKFCLLQSWPLQRDIILK